ncbi:DinB family protein [Marinilongibacter aquaticus]|uniref:DinB family protein n=1 Tax=Marinilongibacter aquaticus TaxID=2975157 RepID=UPI0021BD705E|nr:DinB family protein [Marinilongibacter aquaticus]UBM59544.1 DinB family protein [Marinilongibacter aquaticus]
MEKTNFALNKSIEILQNTPLSLESLLNTLSNDWLFENEGTDTWSPYDVLRHLIVAEKTNWLPRIKSILEQPEVVPFPAFDRFAEQDAPKNIPIANLTEEFKKLRNANLQELQSFGISDEDLRKKGLHPEFGEVNLAQLISTWLVHDLGHLSQINRVMAKHYRSDVGPWINYLSILKT